MERVIEVVGDRHAAAGLRGQGAHRVEVGGIEVVPWRPGDHHLHPVPRGGERRAYGPSSVPGAELDHHVAVLRSCGAFKDVDPLEVLFVKERVRGRHHLGDSRSIVLAGKTGLVTQARLAAEEIDDDPGWTPNSDRGLGKNGRMVRTFSGLG